MNLANLYGFLASTYGFAPSMIDGMTLFEVEDLMSEQHQGQPEGVASTIDQWFRDHVQGTILARDTDVYNHVQAAVEDLKRRLAAIGVK